MLALQQWLSLIFLGALVLGTGVNDTNFMQLIMRDCSWLGLNPTKTFKSELLRGNPIKSLFRLSEGLIRLSAYLPDFYRHQMT